MITLIIFSIIISLFDIILAIKVLYDFNLKWYNYLNILSFLIPLWNVLIFVIILEKIIENE